MIKYSSSNESFRIKCVGIIHVKFVHYVWCTDVSKVTMQSFIKINGSSVSAKSKFSLAEILFSSQERLSSFALHNYVLCSGVQ
jgi:hypothetical protein